MLNTECFRKMSICERAIPYLKPVIKDVVATVRLTPEEQPVVRKLDQNILIFYIADMGNEVHYIQHYDLNAAGMTEAQLHHRSIQNLNSLRSAMLDVQPYGRVYAVFLNGNCETSLLLIDDLWDKQLRHLVKGDFVAALPARDVLAFGDIESPQAVSELREIVRRAEGGDHLITTALYRRVEKQWCRYSD